MYVCSGARCSTIAVKDSFVGEGIASSWSMRVKEDRMS